VQAGAGEQSLTLSGIGKAARTQPGEVNVWAQSDDGELISGLTVDYTKGDSTAQLKFSPSATREGTATIEVGVAVSSSDLAVVRRRFKVTVQGPVNEPPVVQWLSPTNGTVLPTAQALTLRVEASDPDGTIAQVEFRDGTNLLGRVSSAPYEWIWTNISVGKHILSAVATDDHGSSSVDTSVLTVLEPFNQPPDVQWLSPSSGTALPLAVPVNLQVMATDPDGAIAQVEFWDGASSLGVVTSAPYELIWTNTSVGTHILSVMATDDRGSSAFNSAVLTVSPRSNQPPIVQWLNPTSETTLETPQALTLQVEASDADGTIVQVEFWDGTNSLGTVSNAPYELIWTNMNVGTHVLSVMATDDLGDTTASEPVALTVLLPVNLMPIVQWLSPTSETTLETPQAVTLQVEASDADGTIVQVEFRDGTNSLGTVSSAPYELIWTNMSVGTHVLSAVATDNRGGTTASEPVALTVLLPVNQMPIVQWLSPTNETTLETPQAMTLQAAASDADGTIVQVEFRDGTNSLGTVSSAPYELFWTNMSVGTHTLSIVATDDQGGTGYSDSINITIVSTPTNATPLLIRSVELISELTSPLAKSGTELIPTRSAISIEGPAGGKVVVEASSDTTTWVPISTNTLVNGVVYCADTHAAEFKLRFYRARLDNNP